MPQKTKKEKILSQKRREQQLLTIQSAPTYSLDIKNVAKASASQHLHQNATTMTGHADLKKDLIKISLFTVGAIGFQLILFFFVIK